ncbi:MAG: segregation/condensation protein A [Deltaproteobacteria bacterium]|nr:segregation/condensation protein A [Deltaproteobacteria bacterium]
MELPVKLEIFEGPLDLLLHLIRKNEVDIYDIPIALITKQYLAYLELLQEMNIGLAGEYLVMASTLIHLKSRILLPSSAPGSEADEEDDPRLDLVEALKEHLRIKTAAEHLQNRQVLDRDVFFRGGGKAEVDTAAAGREGLVVAGVFDLIEAFRQLISERGKQMILGLPLARLSLEDCMSHLLELLRRRESVSFRECFAQASTRQDLVVTFLAILELTRLGFLRVYQDRSPEALADSPDPAATLRLFLRPLEDEESPEDQGQEEALV